jgi:hypothetical protein
MPARSKSLIGMLWAIAFIGLTGMRAPAQTGGPDHADDPRWSQFRGVAVKTDLKKGVATAIFPPELLAANGKVMDIGGYIVPLEASPDSSHFLLTRRLTGCPFCPPNEANEAVEVFTASKVHYVQHQVFIRGRLKLVESSDAGLFFQFREATAS